MNRGNSKFQEETKEILGEYFRKHKYVSQTDIIKTGEETDLEKQQIRSWFKRKREQARRHVSSKEKENMPVVDKDTEPIQASKRI